MRRIRIVLYVGFIITLSMFSFLLTENAFADFAPESLNEGDVLRVSDDDEDEIFTIGSGNTVVKTGGHFGSMEFNGTYGYTKESSSTALAYFELVGTDYYEMQLTFTSETAGTVVKQLSMCDGCDVFLTDTEPFSIEYATGGATGNGDMVTQDLCIRAVIDSVEKGPIEAVWKKGGEESTSRGDRVIWGHFYANPSDVTWGSSNNPDLFVKIWFDVSGRIDVNYFHVSVPDIEVYSDYPYDGTYDQQGTTTMNNRYIRHEYWSDGPSTESGSSLTNSLGMTFNLIPAGTFTMGSPSDELGREAREAQHQVTLTQSFYMQTTEVTQGQWEAVMGSNPSILPSCGSNCPVQCVSWDDVQTFIASLNSMGEGTYRLPTEAEWEYAARAGSTTAFANGDITEDSCEYDSNLDAMAWYCYNADWPHAVARKQPNAWGLYDMHGNVHEWCQDWYGDYPSGSVIDPTGPSVGSKRVRRGGGWSTYCDAGGCRSAARLRSDPGFSYFDLGFRLLRNP